LFERGWREIQVDRRPVVQIGLNRHNIATEPDHDR
jgi:hypothetical protein